MGNTLREILAGDADFQENRKRRVADKYGPYFGGGSGNQNNPSSGSGAGVQGNSEPDYPDESTPRDRPTQRYWEANRKTGAAGAFTESLERMDRSEIPSSGASEAREALGIQGNTERPTTATTATDRVRSVFVGGNEGALPKISIGKTPHAGFSDAPPAWVTDNDQYTATLNRIGTVKRRPDSELDEPSRGDQSLQQTLQSLGYDPGEVDGYWGEKTDEALKEFKNDQGLGDNAELDETTRRELKKAVREWYTWGSQQ